MAFSNEHSRWTTRISPYDVLLSPTTWRSIPPIITGMVDGPLDHGTLLGCFHSPVCARFGLEFCKQEMRAFVLLLVLTSLALAVASASTGMFAPADIDDLLFDYLIPGDSRAVCQFTYLIGDLDTSCLVCSRLDVSGADDRSPVCQIKGGLCSSGILQRG